MRRQHIYSAFIDSNGVSTDTRTIGEGVMFVALKGERFDANEMVAEALERGARYVVTTNREYESDARVIIVDDTLLALQELAAEHRRHLTCPVVGITGTNGKTTSKELLTAVLSRRYKTYATKGNLNNQIGVPLTILSIKSDAEMAVVEMGASHPGDIKELVDIAMPSSGLITNVGIAHIEGFGSFEGVKRTKGELYDNLRQSGGTVFVDPDNEHLAEMLARYGNVVPYIPAKVTRHEETLVFDCTVAGETHTVKTRLTGDYNLPNVRAAITVGLHYDVPLADILDSIESYQPTNGRSQIVQTERNRIIVDAYNANPSSMEVALTNFANVRVQGEGLEKAVILGAMRELGDEEERQHKKILERLRAMGVGTVYLVGAEFARFGEEYPEFKFRLNTAEMVDEAKTIRDKYILIKGSNSNKLGSLVEHL